MTKKKKKKRPKNPDHLFQRGDIWWIRYNVNGRKIRTSLGTTSVREAKQLRDELLSQRSARARLGLPPLEPAAMDKTMAEVIELWLESRRADESLRLVTRHQSEALVRRCLLPEFGSRRMSSITVEDIERFLVKTRAKCKRSTVAKRYVYLKAIFRQAIRRGWYTGRNPFEKIDRSPTQGPGRDTTLTENEAIRLLAELSGRVHVKSALAMYTGLRWGEVHGLAWADLALDATPATLTVRRSYQGKPKNQASMASVPISKDAVELLRRWRLQQPDGCPWVFPTRFGSLATARSMEDVNKIKQAAKRAGIDKHVTPHVFRHSFGTWVYERTGDPKRLQRLMRHASFASSMRYVHDRRDLAPVVDTLPNLTPAPHLRAI